MVFGNRNSVRVFVAGVGVVVVVVAAEVVGQLAEDYWMFKVFIHSMLQTRETTDYYYYILQLYIIVSKFEICD